MIVSASRRTDIPAFFGDWFIKRVEDGYFYNINPFNPGKVKGYSLLPEDVDAIVFWTKNPEPFLKHLDYLDSNGYNYYFQYTLNCYPKLLEPNLPEVDERIDTFIKLGSRIGRGKVIWRYDPIVISSVTPVEYHIEKLSYIAEKLKGNTESLIISFADFYGKVNNRIRSISKENDIVFTDLTEVGYRYSLLKMCKQIKNISVANGVEVFTCAEDIDLRSIGIKNGSCIDGKMINKLFRLDKDFKKDLNQRKECQCVESVDVGVYNTCRFQCTYCYANYSSKSISNNLAKHCHDSASMINRYSGNIEILKQKSRRGK